MAIDPVCKMKVNEKKAAATSAPPAVRGLSNRTPRSISALRRNKGIY
jgi:hypothetical protein